MNIKILKEKFPSVVFKECTEKYIPRNEDAFYPLGCPKGETVKGKFIRMVNVNGGADTVDASNTDAILRLAEWHQEVSMR